MNKKRVRLPDRGRHSREEQRSEALTSDMVQTARVSCRPNNELFRSKSLVWVLVWVEPTMIVNL